LFSIALDVIRDFFGNVEITMCKSIFMLHRIENNNSNSSYSTFKNVCPVDSFDLSSISLLGDVLARLHLQLHRC